MVFGYVKTTGQKVRCIAYEQVEVDMCSSHVEVNEGEPVNEM